jgi:16S rRNA (guanine527-N7)-methyltransferase
MDLIKLWTLCSSNGIILDADMRENISRYAGELQYWNSKVNLISRKDEDNILERHILHSLSILSFFEPKQKARVIDVGTGGGLPGIPIKIARPDLFVHLIDSIGKKIKMTSMFASHTGLKNISAINTRVEEYHQKTNEKFDLVISRAVARSTKLVRWTKHLVKKETKFIFLKGGDLTEEIEELKDEHNNLKVEVKPLKLIGYDRFYEEDKKIILIENEI